MARAITIPKLGLTMEKATIVTWMKEELGGTCLNWGCFPTKSLIRDSQLFSDLKSSEYLEGEIKLNFGKVME